MPDGTNGAAPDLDGVDLPSMPDDAFTLSMDQVAQVVQQASEAGIVGTPPELLMAVGRHVVGEALGQAQVARLNKQIEDLRKENEVMATDMAVLKARLQEAGVEEAPDAPGAEVAPSDPFPESGAEAASGAGRQAGSEGDPEPTAP